MRLIRPSAALGLLPFLSIPVFSTAASADGSEPRRAVRHHAPAAAREPARFVAIAPAPPPAAPPVGAARAPLPSPTALLLPGAAGVPAFVDLSPVFAAQRACGPGFSSDALQVCRRHGELRVDCGPSGTDCVPLPPDPLPYGPGAAARLAY